MRNAVVYWGWVLGLILFVAILSMQAAFSPESWFMIALGMIAIIVLDRFAVSSGFFQFSTRNVILFGLLVTVGVAGFLVTLLSINALNLSRRILTNREDAKRILLASSMVHTSVYALAVLGFAPFLSVDRPIIQLIAAAFVYMVVVTLSVWISLNVSSRITQEKIEINRLLSYAIPFNAVQFLLISVTLGFLEQSFFITMLILSPLLVGLQIAFGKIARNVLTFSYLKRVYSTVLKVEHTAHISEITETIYHDLHGPLLFSNVTLKMDDQIASFPPERPEILPDVSTLTQITHQFVSETEGGLSTLYVQRHQWGDSNPIVIGLRFEKRHVDSAILKNALLPLLHTLVLFQAKWEREQELLTKAKTDLLTCLQNQRAYFELVERGSTSPLDKPISFLVMDIDDFKLFNDEYGHSVGDDVLRETAARIREAIRQFECAEDQVQLFRSGGEEFSVAVENCSFVQAQEMGEAIRHMVSNEPFQFEFVDSFGDVAQVLCTITVSIGTYTVHEYGELEAGHKTLLEQGFYYADHALVHHAKQNGKNCVWSEYSLDRVEEGKSYFEL